jgi:hypothetical protein
MIPVSAIAAPGDPPRGMGAVDGSIYKAQFAFCSLTTLMALARQQQEPIEGLAPRVAAARLAANKERDLGLAAVQGCRAGLMYRFNTHQTISELRSAFHDRVIAEKYVAGAYLLVMAGFFSYLLIHAAKISRLQRDIAILGKATREAGTEKAGGVGSS